MLGANVEQNGFHIAHGVFRQEDVVCILSSVQRTQVARSRAGIRHLMSDPNVVFVANDPRLISLATQALGQSAFPFRATLFDKSPDSNWRVTWHQDTALPLQERIDAQGWGPWSLKEGIHYAHAPQCALEKIVALRLHLDDSTEFNGPLRVIPGSHNLGLLSDEEVSRIAANRDAFDCIGASGSVLVMRPLLIHASSKSKNKVPRRVLHVEYASSKDVGDGLHLATA